MAQVIKDAKSLIRLVGGHQNNTHSHKLIYRQPKFCSPPSTSDVLRCVVSTDYVDFSFYSHTFFSSCWSLVVSHYIIHIFRTKFHKNYRRHSFWNRLLIFSKLYRVPSCFFVSMFSRCKVESCVERRVSTNW